jgi:hypothetical protein
MASVYAIIHASSIQVQNTQLQAEIKTIRDNTAEIQAKFETFRVDKDKEIARLRQEIALMPEEFK